MLQPDLRPLCLYPAPFYVQHFALAEQNSNDPLYQMQKICRHSRERGNPDPSAWKFIE
ncbi:restriction endonuclease subunit M [Neisseria meningitidis]|uniref:Restriction endonuclease subunit M n=2 Tax=Neisseria meningitidis TaxID=487 RepID=A0A425ANN4_NEIME|nr:restriction endonuclease subunit M [Neisseria meningitidis]MBG8708170.1 restriction endonuclease subunit M [Neisseria meningitidis]MBG8709996.1 restriction endonuclease subunit M [Neisseria meningitidis]MBG8728992.1 restriction endonuclease subunit M [Neisseria meningitidis]MBG8749776.1 restriction endonuclease subunit M [Neisseria meningitidis]